MVRIVGGGRHHTIGRTGRTSTAPTPPGAAPPSPPTRTVVAGGSVAGGATPGGWSRRRAELAVLRHRAGRTRQASGMPARLIADTTALIDAVVIDESTPTPHTTLPPMAHSR